MGEIKYIILSQFNNGEFTGTIEELFEEITIRVSPVEVDFFVVDDRVSPALFYLFSINSNNDGIVQLNDIDLSNYLTDVKTLNTNNTSSLTAESSEAISGTGVINLHKISKTGSYNDLLDKPSIPTIPEIGITDNTSAATKPIIGDITASGHTITVSRIGLDDLGLASAYKYKGSVAKYENLPTSGLNNGDVYNVEESGMNYAWTGTGWDSLGSTVDLSDYMLKADYKANSKDNDGYVTKGSGQASKVWKTDASGNPGWRNDDNTTYSAGTGLLLNETTFSLKNTSVNAHCQQGNTVHHCIALGFTKASTQGHYISLELYSRAGEVIKVNISSNDSTYFAQAVRITNTYGKIKTIYFNSTNGHLYVTTDVYANNLGCKIIACSEDIATPVITTVDSIPEGATTITVVSNITGSGSNNYLAKFNGNNTITSGPALTGDGTKYLNNKGEWATIEIPDVDLSGYIQGSGTIKKIPVFTNASTLGDSAIAMTDQDTVKIDTSSHTSLTDPALHIHHYGPQAADDYAELMILSGLTRNPYGLRFRSHGSGTQIIQSQRIADNSECFGISLNPNGGNVAIGKQTASYKLDVNGSIGGQTLTLTSTDGIAYSDGTNKINMIKFITGTSSGHGIVVGGNGSVVIGAGESASNITTALGIGGNTEYLYLSSDQEIEFYSNCNASSAGNRKQSIYRNSGDLDICGKVISQGLTIADGEGLSSRTKRATWQYNSSTDCVELVW